MASPCEQCGAIDTSPWSDLKGGTQVVASSRCEDCFTEGGLGSSLRPLVSSLIWNSSNPYHPNHRAYHAANISPGLSCPMAAAAEDRRQEKRRRRGQSSIQDAADQYVAEAGDRVFQDSFVYDHTGHLTGCRVRIFDTVENASAATSGG